MLWLDEGYWFDAKTPPHRKGEDNLDFSIYRRCVQYYADEDPDSLKKVGIHRFIKLAVKISAFYEQFLFRCALDNILCNIFLEKSLVH